jgi:hypothetical protein
MKKNLLRIFSLKDKSFLGRVVTVAFILIVVVFLAVEGFCFIRDYGGSDYADPALRPKLLSCNIYYNPARPHRQGFTFDVRTGKKILTGLNWVILSPDDSLAVFSKGHKRGYLNIFTGREVIPATFNKAWVFSHGVAMVLQNDSIYYINHAGERIINQGFDMPDSEDDFTFERGYCRVKRNGKYGAIDSTGRLCVPIEYDCVVKSYRGFWKVCQNDKWGVMNESSQIVFPCENRIANVSEENGIFLSDSVYHCRRYSYEGKLLDDFVVVEVYPLTYATKEMNNDNGPVHRPALCQRYEVQGERYGLMSKDGRPVTEPIFHEIEAVGEDQYFCRYESNSDFNNVGGQKGEGVIINGKGEIVNQ